MLKKFRSILILTLAILAFSACGSIPSRNLEAADSSSLVYLEQNWDHEMRANYYYTPQGSLLIPQKWFGALEQANNNNLFATREHLEHFGILYAGHQPQDRHLPKGLMLQFELPIGFAIDPVDRPGGGHMVGLTCSACHTSRVIINGKTLVVDGAPSMFDMSSFLVALSSAVAAHHPYPVEGSTQSTAKFETFARRILGEDHNPEQLSTLAVEYAKFAKRFVSETKTRLPSHPSGPGRVDALTQITNSLAVLGLGIEENYAAPDAPTSFPPVWVAPSLDWVQWVPIAADPIGRNFGEVLGVFGSVNLLSENDQQFSSSVLLENLFAMEQWIKSLEPPAWQEEIMGPIDANLAALGARLFKKDCLACHNMQVPDADGVLAYRMTDPKENDFGKQWIEITQIPQEKVQTDPAYVTALARTINTGPLANVLFDGKETVGTYEFFFETVAATVRKSFKEKFTANLWEKINYKISGRKTIMEYIDYRLRPPAYVCPGDPPLNPPPEKPKQYKPCYFDTLKAGPLEAVWATGPFLHNGSVPNLDELLSSPADRSKTFWVGSRELDTTKLGFVSTEESGGLLFDTRLAGNFNGGHDFRHIQGLPAYSSEERRQIIEYLKDPARFAIYLASWM
jgi:cytochrome c5